MLLSSVGDVELTVMRERAAGAKVAHLATVRPDGTPHVVPCCFVLDRDTTYSAIDAKSKSTAKASVFDTCITL